MEVLIQWSYKNLKMDCGGQGDGSVDEVLTLKIMKPVNIKSE